MTTRILQHYVGEFREGRDLDADDIEDFMDALLNETDEPMIAELLTRWNSKGTTEDELFGLAIFMRARMTRIGSNRPGVIDIVGTGGSRSKTFNVSTAAAFVIAGAEIPVAKHGNRAATSKVGSADVLELLGVNIDISPETAERCLDKLGLCFMFAPRFHSLSPTLAKVRRELGRPTIFNNVGPLCNPAGATHQIIGVWSRELLDSTAAVLARLGTRKSWVVHGETGLDEIALTGQTYISEVVNFDTALRTICAADFGVNEGNGNLPTAICPSESAVLIREILQNQRSGEDAENLVLINSAAAIYIAGRTADLREAFARATASVRSGAALNKLASLAAATNQ